ncbi:MAG TPA: type II toxin-antitoxin system RelE/ParE family toxin [Thermoanaerobaculia bacterium]
MFLIEYTKSAFEDLRFLRRFEQRLIMDTVDRQLATEPLVETRNRKLLRPNELAEWELRIEVFRVFYDVDVLEGVVRVKGIGWKEHNRLLLRGKEMHL